MDQLLTSQTTQSTLPAFSSHLVADTGISMGDEGKGRIVCELIEDIQSIANDPSAVEMILKVNGGANSGHTAAGIKLNLIPSGIHYSTVSHLALGAGVVADPCKLLWELSVLKHKGFDVAPRLKIDERTMVSDFSHRILDLAWENYRANVLQQPPRGSTGRGITPAFSDEVNQWALFFHVFKGPKDSFVRRLRARLNRTAQTVRYVCHVCEKSWFDFFETLSSQERSAHFDAIEEGAVTDEAFNFKRFAKKDPFEFNEEALIEHYWSAGQKLVPNITDIRQLVLAALHKNRFIIGEFGQSFWLDKRQGFLPNVTASHTYTPEFFQSAGIPLQPIHTVACCKAYDTKVGTHHFLTEIEDSHPLAAHLKKLEFGTSTGRQRMVGWFDAVEKAGALRHGGFEDLAINKLDALTYTGNWQAPLPLRVCVAYQDSNNNRYTDIPRNEALHKDLIPIYQELPGWSQSIEGVRSFQDLPINAQRYIAFTMDTILKNAYPEGLPSKLPQIRYIGVGPNPQEIIKDVPETQELIKNFLPEVIYS
jgi:adenylosuccinate synthase